MKNNINTNVSNLVSTTFFWNYLHEVGSKPHEVGSKSHEIGSKPHKVTSKLNNLKKNQKNSNSVKK